MGNSLEESLLNIGDIVKINNNKSYEMLTNLDKPSFNNSIGEIIGFTDSERIKELGDIVVYIVKIDEKNILFCLKENLKVINKGSVNDNN